MSRTLRLISIFMIGFPIFYPLFATYTFDFNSKGVLSTILSPVFYILGALWVASGIGIQNMKHWAWYTHLMAQVLMIYVDAVNIISHSESPLKGLAFILTLLVQLLIFMVVSREMRVPYLFPRVRWWESGIAGMNHFPVEVIHSRSMTGVTMGQMLDISHKGCFIKSHIDFNCGERIKLTIHCGDQAFDLPGVIVWNARSTVTHPKGIGVKFLDIDRKVKRKIRLITKRFEQQGAIQYEAKPLLG